MKRKQSAIDDDGRGRVVCAHEHMLHHIILPPKRLHSSGEWEEAAESERASERRRRITVEAFAEARMKNCSSSFLLPFLRSVTLPSLLPSLAMFIPALAQLLPIPLCSPTCPSLSLSLSLSLPSPMFLPPQLTRERETLSGNNRMVCCEHARGKPNCTYTCNLTFGAV